MHLHAPIDPRLLTLEMRHLLLALSLTLDAHLLTFEAWLLLALGLAFKAGLLLLTFNAHLLAFKARMLLTLDAHLLAFNARLLLLTFDAHLLPLSALLLLGGLLLAFGTNLLTLSALLLGCLLLAFGAHLLTISARGLLLLGRGLLGLVATLPAAAAMLAATGMGRGGDRQRRDRRDQKGLGHGKIPDCSRSNWRS